MKELSQNQLRQILERDEEVIDFETDEKGRVYPVVRAYDDGEHHLRFWCIHCRNWHLHGRGGPNAPYQEGRGGMAGHRVAHCTAKNSPFKSNGVILHVVGKFDENVKRQHRKGSALYCPICSNQYSAAFNACECAFINRRRKPSNDLIARTYAGILTGPSTVS